MNASIRRLAFLAAALLLTASPAHAADGSLEFSPATQQRVEMSNFAALDISTAVTVEFWAKTNDSGQQSAFMLNPDQGTNRFQAHINYFNGNTYWDCGDAGNGGRLQVGSPANSVGNWTHYAFVSSASGEGFMKIYVNGAEIASKTGASPFNTAGNGTTGYTLSIGGYTSYFLNGSLDEFRIWNVARTQWEIQRDLGAELTGSEPGLRLYYKFDEGSASIAENSATATGDNCKGFLWTGALRTAPARLVVANTNNSGAGSLRQAVADAAAAPGSSYITFDPLLSGQTIKLDSEIAVNDATGPVTIDASSLPGGLTLDGSGGAAFHRVFEAAANSTLSLHGLTLTGAKAGAIVSFGSLTLTRCTLFGNSFSSGDGGGIFSDKPLALTHCTLAGNTAERGGAIFVYKTGSIFTHCTLSGNTATISGGAISCPNKSVVLENCIVAGNIDGDAGTATDNIECGGVIGDPNLFSDDPLLSPLGYYGGSTMTMRPLPGSPAIDGGSVIAGLSTDQRGFARNVDGNANGGAQPDIGAVELNLVTVTTTADENDTPVGAALSLREAVRSNQADIFFAPTLNGQTIRLTLGTEIVLNQSVSIDASSLPAGLTVDGISSSGDNRLFTVSSSQSVAMTGLTLTGGQGGGSVASGNGGAILNLGRLSMTRCTVSGNSTTGNGHGGAVDNRGVLNLTACSVVLNGTSFFGGGLKNSGTATLMKCTVAGNTGSLGTGGISNSDPNATVSSPKATLTLEHCTVGSNSGGGIYNGLPATLYVKNMVVAGNTGFNTEEFYNDGTVVPSGLSLVLGPFNSSLPGSGTVTNTLFIGYNPNISLGQLGYYGGGMPTMLPKAGSPIIDASFGSTITTDQRGFPVTGTKPDIGAVERRGSLDVLTVTTTADELDAPNNAQTSLREAITDGAAAKIVFAAALNGGTITLESSRGEIAITRGVSVDATSLPKGLTLHGGTGTNRIFNINVTDPDQVSLKCLTLTGGEAPGGSGGAILAGGTGSLTIQRCTFTGNTAAEGGGIFSTASLALESCTFSGNTGNYGGALQCLGYTAIANCTISGNQGPSVGGGIFNKFTTMAKPLVVINSIISGNTSPWPDGDDIYSQSGVIWFLEANIVGSRYQDINSSVVIDPKTPLPLTSDPLLGPLRDYGGPTRTMALKPGSPALDASTGNSATSDQRGYPIVGVADLGAYEAGAGVDGAKVNFDLWAWEIYGQDLLPDGDNDNDAIKNLAEYANKTDPFVANTQSVSHPSPNTGGGSSAAFSLAGGDSEAAAAPPPSVLSYDFNFRYNPEATDLRYILQRSSDLSPTGWTDIYTYDSTTGLITEASGVIGDEDPDGNLIYITDSTFNPARTFWRLVVEQP